MMLKARTQLARFRLASPPLKQVFFAAAGGDEACFVASLSRTVRRAESTRFAFVEMFFLHSTATDWSLG